MELGMYSIEIERPGVEALFAAVREYGFSRIQFDFSSVCEEQMPQVLDEGLLQNIRSAADANRIEITAVNGTFNMIHPEKSAREEGLRRLEVMAKACSTLGCSIITLCTGSRNAENMWRGHQDNGNPEAMEDLKETMSRALEIAGRYEVTLGVECEPNNCIDSAKKARELLDFFSDRHLKIIMDAANLFREGEARQENVKAVIDDAFEHLGEHICLAHGKDIKGGEGLHYTYAGNGIIDFPYFNKKLEEAGYKGSMILHGIKSETDFKKAVSFMREQSQTV
ncbi:sugar phosphate isomerase/epimerase [Blautia sp. JLR.GB0024]|uniref:sugar phosphate isomerase/epimerase family protein n=1 Tax=Blautia sp. JLR.GB0024 TaxID=3123295 RepID=UPI00300776AF